MVTNILDKTKAKLSKGWSKVGLKLGSPHVWYPLVGTTNPIVPENNAGTFLTMVDRESTFAARLANEYGKMEFYFAYDRKGPQVGDYLVGEDDNLGTFTDTYFIIDQSDLTPSKGVKCTCSASFYKAADDVVLGTQLASDIPICKISGSRGEQSTMELPSEGRRPWWTLYVPALPGVKFHTDDVMIVDGVRYTISSPELTYMGWRMTAKTAG